MISDVNLRLGGLVVGDNEQELVKVTTSTAREYKNLTEFLEKCLNKRVVQYAVKPLTESGDNYNSVLHAIEVKSIQNNSPNEVQRSIEIFHQS